MVADFAALRSSANATRPDGPAGVVRRLPVGAESQPGGGVHFRVWAPRVHEVAVEMLGAIGGAAPIALEAEGEGYYSGLIADARPGMRYGFRTDMLDKRLPVPASRFQA